MNVEGKRRRQRLKKYGLIRLRVVLTVRTAGVCIDYVGNRVMWRFKL